MRRLAAKPRQSLAWVGPLPAAGTEVPVLNRAQRRQRRVSPRAQLREAKRTRRRSLHLDDVPAGSLLSEQTLASIDTGMLDLVQVDPPPPRPAEQRARELAAKRRRAKIARASRKRNRAR